MMILPMMMIIIMMMMMLIMMKKKNLHSERDGDIHVLLKTTFYDVSMCFFCRPALSYVNRPNEPRLEKKPCFRTYDFLYNSNPPASLNVKRLVTAYFRDNPI